MDPRLLIQKVFIIGLLLAAAIFGPHGSDEPSRPAPQAASDDSMLTEEATAVPVSFPDHVRQATATVDGARIAAADQEPGNWLSHGRTYSEQRFSPLGLVNDSNVDQLGLAWSFDTNTTRGLEATPIVVDGVIYTTGSWSKVYALNAKTGDLLWQYDPKVPGEWAKNACCDVVNRGVAVWQGKVYVGTIDGRLIALDAADGQVVWDVNTIDTSRPYTITAAPRIVKGKVLIGNGGAEFGVRGYFTAYDAETGELAWRFFTVPGDPSQPFEQPELEMAAKTWDPSGKYWEVGGGGTVWDSMAYDPELDLLYVGTGNGSPWSRWVRSPGGGDNLFLSSILAVRPDTGELVWYYQTTPGDTWDYTATQHMILADLEIDGTSRKVLMQAPKNGFFYILDRATGELLSAEKYVSSNWASHVDMETGRPIEDAALHFDKQPQQIYPSSMGGHNWHPMAFNPNTGLVYIPATERGFIYLSKENWTPNHNSWNLGVDWALLADIIEPLDFGPDKGYLKAWDPVSQKEVWSVEHMGPLNGGVLTTAGNLIFQGTGDGKFSAYRADTGQVIWSAPIMTGIIAAPVTYTVEGEQYVAIMAGWGGIAISASNPDSAPTAQFGNNGRLLVFKLGGNTPLPILEDVGLDISNLPVSDASAEDIRDGSHLYAQYCLVCHGAWAISSGVLPDLRKMTPPMHAAFDQVVRAGAMEHNGMPSLSEHLSEEQAKHIQAYIIHRAKLSLDRQAAANEPEPIPEP